MTGAENPEISTALAVEDPVAADEAQAALEWITGCEPVGCQKSAYPVSCGKDQR